MKITDARYRLIVYQWDLPHDCDHVRSVSEGAWKGERFAEPDRDQARRAPPAPPLPLWTAPVCNELSLLPLGAPGSELAHLRQILTQSLPHG